MPFLNSTNRVSPGERRAMADSVRIIRPLLTFIWFSHVVLFAAFAIEPYCLPLPHQTLHAVGLPVAPLVGLSMLSISLGPGVWYMMAHVSRVTQPLSEADASAFGFVLLAPLTTHFATVLYFVVAVMTASSGRLPLE